MKKRYCLLFVMLVSLKITYVYAQKSNLQVLKKDELKFNPVNFKLDITYERILHAKNSFGISIGNDFLYDGDNDSFGILPYYRRYFGTGPKIGKGFFIEANTLLYEVSTPDFFLGIGGALGYKYLSEKNFIFEIFSGLGFEGELSYYRFSFMIGKRF